MALTENVTAHRVRLAKIEHIHSHRIQMTDTLNIALAQLNPTVGDIEGNIALVIEARADAARQHADLVVMTELTVCGYPPEDLVQKPAFLDIVEAKVKALAARTDDGGPALLLGAPWRDQGHLYNAALLLDGGVIAAITYKHELPNYGVFDEKRIFSAANLPEPMPFRGLKLGVMVCEDMWKPAVTENLSKQGADLLVVLNGSPYELDKKHVRLDYARARATESGLGLIYVNQVGGQDELVFDGDSFVVHGNGTLGVRLPSWQRVVATNTWRCVEKRWVCEDAAIELPSDNTEAVYHAVCLGLRDYVNKNRFPGVLIGLSGGIDSALSAVVAVDALGPERVHCVMMPSPYTSQDSLDDAAEVARLLGCRLDTISIEPAMGAFDIMLKDAFAQYGSDTTEENIQARSRGVTLMALSNKFGHMVLSTGNKSEMSVGYATLYGDMCGGYSVLKDIYKTTVFALSRWRNEHRPADALGPQGRAMPDRVITKPPSAELKPDQKDEDSLPPYDKLDDILHGLIEGEQSLRDIAARGHDMAIVERIWHMLDRAEYKRRQAPPGVKISSRAFGRDRRYPITNGFTGHVLESDTTTK